MQPSNAPRCCFRHSDSKGLLRQAILHSSVIRARMSTLHGRGNVSVTLGVGMQEEDFNEAKSVAGNHWLPLSPSGALLRGQV